MQLPNNVWDDIITQAAKNVDVLKDHEAVKQLGSILKTNVRACKALGHPFVMQLGRIYLDMLNVYKVMSENISTAVSLNGEVVTRQPLIKSMRVVKKETMKQFYVVNDMYDFDNIGFTKSVDNNTIKYLICADCEVGPLGWHCISSKKNFVALARVKHV